MLYYTYISYLVRGPGSVSGPYSCQIYPAGRSGNRILVESEIFRTCPDRPWGPPSLLYNGYLVFPRGKKRPGSDADPLPLYQCHNHERLELYLYSPYEPCGLYRASVPVQ
jgi:hypothetical protein